MFKLQNVTFCYFEGNLILKNINFYFKEGEFVLIKGPSGGGKSTFLRLFNRLIIPQAGEIFFKGKPLDIYDVTLLRRQVVYLQQMPVLMDASVKDNLLLPFSFRSAMGIRPPGDNTLQIYLHKFLLGGLSLRDNARNLSAGQKQRLALIRALLLKPEVLLLDEPTASLDQESREIVEDQIETINQKESVGIIMVSHTDYVIQKVKSRVLFLEKGVLKEII